MSSTETAPAMADLKKMSKACLVNLAAQQRIQIALLQAVRDDVMQQPKYDRLTLVDVMVHHWPTATSGCSCGWAVLGHSFPEHLADQYEEARDG